MWGSISFASEPVIQDDFHHLKNLGYTGKGVKVGIIDSFEYSTHGRKVEHFIKAVAPDATIYREDDSTFYYLEDENEENIYSAIKRQFSALTIIAKEYAAVFSSRRLAPDKSLDMDPGDFLAFEKGEEIHASLVYEGDSKFHDVYKVSKNGKEYYLQLRSFDNSSFIIKVKKSLNAHPNMSLNFRQAVVTECLRRLFTRNVNIVNYSAAFFTGNDLEEALRVLAEKKGVLMISAGNTPLALGRKEITYSTMIGDFFNPGSEYAAWASLQWRKRVKTQTMDACLLVGALKKYQEIADYSTRAGVLKDNFITAVVNEEEGRPVGTSFSAPQITGLMALLQEAYPTCTPQIFKEAILESGAVVGTDPSGALTGRGRVYPLAAFKKVYEICGVAPQGLEGQQYLLPILFKVEDYLNLNPDLKAHASNMTSAQKEAFGIQHYLEHGLREGRQYKEEKLPAGFDTDAYIYAHPDLTAHTKAMTPAQRRSFAYEHYLAHGKEEGRSYQPSGILQTFNPEAYLSLHADVKVATQGMTPEDARSFAYWHYVHHGAQEGRQHAPDVLPQGFNPQRYLELNSDVKNHTKSMPSAEASSFATWHYINHGQIEKRRY